MRETTAIDCIDRGLTTAEEIADETGLSYQQACRELKKMCEDGVLVRERDGRSFVYDVADEQPAHDGGDSPIIVERNYDWDTFVPTHAAEYVPTNGELDRIKAKIETREVVGRPARFLVGGPTGCGKTTLAESIAAENDWPLFTIQCQYNMYAPDLVGSARPVGDRNVWQDGELTKAILASRERPVVVLIDEANRARPEVKSVLFSALDHRATVPLDELSTAVTGNAMNIISFATVNEGSEYVGTMEMDPAEKRRLGAKYDTNYLGIEYPEREAELVAARVGVTEAYALQLVKAANEVRRLASDDDSHVRMGVPTSNVIDWAATARAFDLAGIPNPTGDAMTHEVVEPLYGDNRNIASEVATTMGALTNDLPVADAEAIDAWANDEDEVFVCKSCGYTESTATAPAVAQDFSECPTCDTTEHLKVITRSV